MQWHYSMDGSQHGPVDDHAIRALVQAGKLGPDSMIWSPGMADWAMAKDIPHLADMLSLSPSLRSAPPTTSAGIGPLPKQSDQGDQTGGVIPYKNPLALAAYYIGICALIPCIGPMLGIGSIVLGIAGLKARKRNPAIKGSVHAWIGIVLGALSLLGHGLVVVLRVILS